MNLVVETDIGHDPDDFFALCYLAAAGVDIRAVMISPGDPDQIAIARLLCDRLGLEIPIGVAKENRTKLSSGSIHHELLRKYKRPLEAKGDGLGVDLLPDIFDKYPDAELFVIGPVTSLGKYLGSTAKTIKRATMQGGFLPYYQRAPKVRLEQFEGRSWMPTFNLNGDRPNGENFLNADIERRQMVGKNVCHTVLFDAPRFATFKSNGHPGADLFLEAGHLYFAKHTEKKFHDPTAACLHLHPEVATWFRGKTYKVEQGWGTHPDLGDDYICADVDYDQLWEFLGTFR